MQFVNACLNIWDFDISPPPFDKAKLRPTPFTSIPGAATDNDGKPTTYTLFNIIYKYFEIA